MEGGEGGRGDEGKTVRSPFQKMILSPANQTLLQSHQSHLCTLRSNSLVIIIIRKVILIIVIIILPLS